MLSKVIELESEIEEKRRELKVIEETMIELKNKDYTEQEKVQAYAGAYLSKKRKERNYTQEQVAEAIGMSRMSYANFERGSQMISLYNLYKLSSILLLSMDYMFDEISNKISK